MASRNWGFISSGETFEALVETLVFFEDAGARLFGRRGKDGGQDVLSGNGRLVYQAKYHASGSSGQTIADAKREAEKVERYRKQGNKRYKQWRNVTEWRLVTNATFNPTDLETWEREVVPVFAKMDIAADYWERANLDALLAKHPEVDRSFFESETRVFLTIPEVRLTLSNLEPFLSFAVETPFVGRQSELDQVKDFLASKKLFLITHGAGGTGKTRLLIEAGDCIAAEGYWQVLWANVETMATSSTWFEGIQPERPTVLLVDDPPNESVFRVLLEQLGGRLPRASNWKVLGACPLISFRTVFVDNRKISIRSFGEVFRGNATYLSTVEGLCGVISACKQISPV